MQPLTDNQRKRVAIIFTNVGIVTFAGFVITQLVERTKFNFLLFTVGLIFSLLCFLLAIYSEPD